MYVRIHQQPSASKLSCPLCRDQLGTRHSVTCTVCQGRVHTSCARELGMCHGGTPRSAHASRASRRPQAQRRAEVYSSEGWVAVAFLAGFIPLVVGLGKLMGTTPTGVPSPTWWVWVLAAFLAPCLVAAIYTTQHE